MTTENQVAQHPQGSYPKTDANMGVKKVRELSVVKLPEKNEKELIMWDTFQSESWKYSIGLV